jgi:dTDP-4-amino-4,6-dideoxygalactose transaminase
MTKNSYKNLAILGGTPAFADTLHVGRPNIGNREKLLARINDMLDRHWFSNNGPFLLELEQKLAKLLNVKNCIVMTNGTVALEVAARTLGLQGEVIVPSFTFVASVHALQWLGITPVFCDIDHLTHNIAPEKIEKLITPRTTGILGVHVWGRACDVDALSVIARKHQLKLMFDAAHAFACTHHGKKIGGFGDAEVLSFHATKFFNTFEGGAITTNNDELAERIRSARNFGFAGLDNVISLGTNGKMSEVSAAMGLTSLESLNEFISANYNNYLAYYSGLRNLPGVQLVHYDSQEKNNYQYIVIEVEEKITGLSRDLLLEILHAENIRARRYFYPGCHQVEPYRSESSVAGLSLPETEKVTQRVLQLPTGTSISSSDIEKICDIIRFSVSNSEEIIERMRYKHVE